MSDRIKCAILTLFLIFLPMTSANTYTLGSHQVSFNISEPYNSSAKFDTPIYNTSGPNSWAYTLNMTVDPKHSIKIYVLELGEPDYGMTWPSGFAEARANNIKIEGIGGYKYSTMDFKGYPAYQESYPAQKSWKTDEMFIERRSRYALCYEIDEKTVVHVIVDGDDIPYQELLDTIEVTEAPTKPTKYAPYISQ